MDMRFCKCAGRQTACWLEYPEDALREAILNSIIHKDYTGFSVQSSVYDSKLILWNPGRLPEDLSIEMLKRKHPSRPHNRNIADIFFKAGYIEAWGRGIDLIISECQRRHLPEPAIEEHAGGVQSTFFKAPSELNVPEKRIDAILNLLRKNPRIAIAEMAQICNVSDKTIKRDIEKLKDTGTIT